MNTGTARLRTVPPLQPEEAALEQAILQGFADHHALLHHREHTISAETAGYWRFRAFTGRAPWEWGAIDMDRFGAAMRRRGFARETMRAYQGAIRRVLRFARDPAYDWQERCAALTSKTIPQICTPENTLVHQHGAPTSKRRNFTDRELERLFERLRDQVSSAPTPREQFAAAIALAISAAGLAFGARQNELRMADLADLVRAVQEAIRQFSAFQGLSVRFGKASGGGPPRQRHVPAIYFWRDFLGVLDWYVREIRPHLVRAHSPDALFLNTFGNRLRPDAISKQFRQNREGAGLSPDLTFHCLRHTFATKLREQGLDLSSTAKLLGHSSEASTVVYDHLGSEFLQATLREFQRVTMQRERHGH